jgi:hypothetical protein
MQARVVVRHSVGFCGCVRGENHAPGRSEQRCHGKERFRVGHQRHLARQLTGSRQIIFVMVVRCSSVRKQKISRRGLDLRQVFLETVEWIVLDGGKSDLVHRWFS